MSHSYSIYALTDPRTRAIRYVGVTRCTLQKRLGDHIRKSRCGEKTHRATWIRSLLALNLKPEISLLETTESGIEREIFWIQAMRDAGHDLTNGTNGGEGFGIWTDEARRQASKRSTGRQFSLETRQKISMAHKGRVHSEATKERLRAINTGKRYGPLSPATIEKMRQSKLGHAVSEETRKKISEKLTGVPRPNRIKTYCKNGHAYTPENTLINVRGAQECRICRKATFDAAYQRRKNAAKSLKSTR